MKKIPQRTAIFTAAYVLFFGAYAVYDNNYEFIFYSFLLLVLLLFVVTVYRRVEISNWIVLSLSVFGFFHLLGGNLVLNGVRLYDLEYFGGAFHFDNIMHSLGIFITTLIAYTLLYPFLDQRVRDRYGIIYFLIILMALGIGAINEIIELTAVVFLGAGETVGDYYNNAFDLVYNFGGALVAIAVIHKYIRHLMKIKVL